MAGFGVPRPREWRDRFWEVHSRGVRIKDAALEAGVEYEAARDWVYETGGVRPRPQKSSGRYLALEEREIIGLELALGTTMAAIAAMLGRHPSTIGREFARNKQLGSAPKTPKGSYRPLSAQGKADRRARRPKMRKLEYSPRLAAWVEKKLALNWSPKQISSRLLLAFPDDEEMRISHEAIYQSLYVQGRGGLRKELHKHLRSGRSLRKPKRKLPDQRGRIPGMVMISERPAEVNDRAIPGHWEGDLIIGRHHQSAIGTLVERTTRYLILLHLLGPFDAPAVRDAIINAIGTLPASLRRTLTWDQGRELARHAEITLATDMKVYFCDPHSPWQRGSNENTNGLIRQYFPKSTDLSVHSIQRLNEVADQLNGRPRQTLNWYTPAEKLNELLLLKP